HFVADTFRGAEHGTPANRRRTAAEGADAGWHARGGVEEHTDGFERNTQLVGHDLAERCDVALAVWRGARQQRHLARGFDPHSCAFPRPERADLQIARDADADQRLARVVARPGLPLAKV